MTDINTNIKFTLGADEDSLDDEYRSYADRQLDQLMTRTYSIAEAKGYEKTRDDYNAWERRQVAEAVAREMRGHAEKAELLGEVVAPAREEVNELLRQIDGRKCTAAHALSRVEAIRRRIEDVRGRRDELAAGIRISELKAEHPHRYMDTMHRSFPSLERRSIFGEATSRPIQPSQADYARRR